MRPARLSELCDVDIGSTEAALIDAWHDMEPRMRRVALRFAEDEDHADDLIQEALIELWLIDSSRFALDDPRDAAYLRRMLLRRMRDVRRADASGVRSREQDGWCCVCRPKRPPARSDSPSDVGSRRPVIPDHVGQPSVGRGVSVCGGAGSVSARPSISPAPPSSSLHTDAGCLHRRR